MGQVGRRRIALTCLLACAMAALTLVPAASAQTSASCGYGTGGPSASNLCWFDMTDYSDATARSAPGQPMSIDLPGGYTASLTLTSRPVTGVPTHQAIEDRATPLENRFAFGSTGADGGYRDVPGRPALYSFGGAGGVDLTLSDIEVVDSAGQTVSGYRFVIADAENNVDGEDFTWTSDQPLNLIGVLNDDAPAGCNVGAGLSGLGTTTVTCNGAGAEPGPPDPRYDNAIVGADTPSTIGLSMTTFARSAVAFGIMTSKIQVTKAVDGRVNASDSFDVFASSPEGSEIARGSTGSADAATTGELTVLPRTSGAGYTLAEEPTPASGTRLSDYRQSWTCTNNGAPYTPTGAPDGTSVGVAPSVGDDIECTVTNTAPPPPLDTCLSAERRATERWWFFGNKAGIDFGTSGTGASPLVIGPNINSSEGTTVVTDTAGRLRFWSNGQTVYNADHQAMPNGTGLQGNVSATQTVAAFPAIGDPDKYFVVVTAAAEGPGNLSYSVVDMSLDGGKGAVTATKNVALGVANTASEALTAVPNADGTGFWVLTYTPNSPNVVAHEFDATGPVGSPVVSAMPTNNFRGYGTLNFSADLKELVAATTTLSMNPNQSRIRLLGFDADTGQVWQKLEWALPATAGSGTSAYSADFSPTGDYVYATKIFGGARLYRYRVAGNSTGADVKATELNVGSIGTNGGQVKRAPNGRMYAANANGTALSVVADPDSSTSNVGFTSGGFALSAGSGSRFGLPQLVTGCPQPAESDLEVVKSAAPAVPEIGDTVTFTLDVANDGPDDSPAVMVTDVLPAGLEYVSNDSGCNVSALPTITCQLGAMANGGSDSVQIVAEVAAGSSGQTIENTALVSGPNVDPVPGDNVSSDSVSVAPASDLALTKTADPAVADPGDDITYTLIATNEGPDAESAATITDSLPAGVTYVSDDGSCDVSSLPQITCDLGALADGATSQVQIVVEVDAGAGGTFPTNTATVSGAGTDDNQLNDTAEAEVRVRPIADLSLAKSADPVIADPGGTVTYTLTVANDGPSDTPSAGITDTLPAGVTYASDDGGCDTSGLPQVTCPLPAIADGGSHTVEITATVNSGAGNTTQTNTASVAGPLTDPDNDNDSDDADVFVNPVSDLSVTKSAPASSRAGRQLTYAITYANDGPTASPAPTTITDTLPAGTSYVSDTGGCDTSALPLVSCQVGPVPVDGGGTVEIVVVTDPSLRGPIQNTAEIAGPNTEPVPQNNEDDASTQLIAPLTDLAIEKDGTPSVTDPGDPVTYSLTVTNNGPDAAEPGDVTDTLPDGLTYVSDDAGCDVSALPQITCAVGALADGATETIEIDAVVDAGASGTRQTNTATVAGPGEDLEPSNDTDTVDTLVTPLSDLSLGKSAPPGPFQVGDQVPYTFTVGNDGPTESPGTVVTDELPAALTYVSDDAGCDTSALPRLSCDLGTLPDGASRTFTVITRLDQDTGSVTNAASVAGQNADPDPGDEASTAQVDSEPASAATTRCFFGNRATIVGTNRSERIEGTPGRDVINARGGKDVILGLDGDDLICGGAGNDLIKGGQGDDRVKGSDGDDVILGNRGNDWLRGAPGDDRISGRQGNDRLMGNKGNDRLRGRSGKDLLLGGPGLDWGDGGPGADRGLSLETAFSLSG